MLGVRSNLSLVVSGGGSARAGLGRNARIPAATATVNSLTNSRRLTFMRALSP